MSHALPMFVWPNSLFRGQCVSACVMTVAVTWACGMSLAGTSDVRLAFEFIVKHRGQTCAWVCNIAVA
jgi:hypothetical protein